MINSQYKIIHRAGKGDGFSDMPQRRGVFMAGTIRYLILGYLSGSVLFAQVVSKVFSKGGMIENSRE